MQGKEFNIKVVFSGVYRTGDSIIWSGETAGSAAREGKH